MEEWDNFKFEAYLLTPWEKCDISEWMRYNEIYIVRIRQKMMTAQNAVELKGIQEWEFSRYFKSTQQLTEALGLIPRTFAEPNLYIGE
jgi:hypothetical protein